MVKILYPEIKIEEKALNTTSYIIVDSKRYKEFGNIYSFLINAELKGRFIQEVNNLKSFLSFIKMKSISYVGISEKNYRDYLLELIIKFNSREKNYFDLLLNFVHFLRVAETTHSPNFLMKSGEEK